MISEIKHCYALHGPYDEGHLGLADESLVYQHEWSCTREVCNGNARNSPKIRIATNPELILGEEAVVNLTSPEPHPQAIQTVCGKADFWRKDADLTFKLCKG